jgi:hypothetical protein
MSHTFHDVDPMTRQYVETALWSTNDESTPAGGEPFDANYSGDDIEAESLGKMATDCKAFRDLVAAELPFLIDLVDQTDLGHDFWLTRAGHGCGFWDGDYSWLDRDGIDVGERLTELCDRFGARSLYLSDDGAIYEMSA